METACGIQEHHVVAVLLGMLHGGLGNVHRVCGAHLEHRDAKLSAHDLQLLDSGGTVHVTGHQQGVLAVLFHQARQLCTIGGLTGALEAHQHDHCGGLGRDLELCVFAAHEGNQLFVDDLDDHLGRSQAFQHIAADGPLGDLFDKVLDHLIADVRFQQSQAYFSHGLLYVGFGEPSLAAELFKRTGQLFS